MPRIGRGVIIVEVYRGVLARTKGSHGKAPRVTGRTAVWADVLADRRPRGTAPATQRGFPKNHEAEAESEMRVSPGQAG